MEKCGYRCAAINRGRKIGFFLISAGVLSRPNDFWTFKVLVTALSLYHEEENQHQQTVAPNPREHPVERGTVWVSLYQFLTFQTTSNLNYFLSL